MVAYEIYYNDQRGKEHLVGILPERRRIRERITKESVLKWGMLALGPASDIEPHNLYFVTVEL